MKAIECNVIHMQKNVIVVGRLRQILIKNCHQHFIQRCTVFTKVRNASLSLTELKAAQKFIVLSSIFYCRRSEFSFVVQRLHLAVRAHFLMSGHSWTQIFYLSGTFTCINKVLSSKIGHCHLSISAPLLPNLCARFLLLSDLDGLRWPVLHILVKELFPWHMFGKNFIRWPSQELLKSKAELFYLAGSVWHLRLQLWMSFTACMWACGYVVFICISW